MTAPPAPDPSLRATTSFQAESPEPAIDMPLEQAVAQLPADLLQRDETILLLIKPSFWFILLASLETLGGIAVLGGIALWARDRFGFGDWYHPDAMVALCVLLALVRLFWQFVEWWNYTYVLTDRRVIRIMGVFRRQMFQAPLRQLQHTEIHRSLRERLTGVGTISFATAGSAYPEAYWLMIRQPLTVHRTILQAIQRYG